MSVPHPEGGNIIWNCVKDNTIKENEEYESIGLRGFDYKIFEEERDGVILEGLYGYPYLNHLINLWPGDWVNHM